MNRRTFLAWVGVGSLASSFPVALAACSNPENTANIATRPDGFTVAGTIQELDEKGSIFNSQLPALIIRNPKNIQEVFAVNPTCPHLDCIVKWEASKKEFGCPCHASQFTPDGQVIKGPADRELKPYLAKVEGNIILVKLS
ncbi:QcrA and Rieske domain-containing protein [Planktothrix paucivesiculata]|uniref:Rieske (2Fe-2S) iron-sulfur domain protein n=1 Tax=Planktothrix paucivesiculata PCC 9631 TaxID=671071 RepID=A0A7Z9E1M6_9CYAN|nr:Rieske 2Fe-2S domain-containing protein [Planktothrix paucivesiculata]VXD22994.1 Rieske (2Fe-2S) iron-sulfur domain protein [Planktothrix paucivesiculata PCC 9631]